MEQDRTEQSALGNTADVSSDLIRVQQNLAIQLSDARDLNETLQLCVAATMEISGMDAGGIYLVDQTSGDLNLVFSIGLSEEFLIHGSRFSADSPNAQIVMVGKPVYVNYRNLDLPLDERPQQEGLMATAVFPISRNGSIIACLNVASRTLTTIPTDTRSALETMISQIGNALARAKAEEALRENEHLLKQAQTIARIGHWTYDPKTETLRGSDELYAILGFEEPIYSIDILMETVHPEDINFCRYQFNRGIKRGENWEIEHRLLLTDGTIKSVHSIGEVYKNSSGAVERLVGTIQDISERKLAERILRIQRDLNATLGTATTLDQAMTGILDHILLIEGVDVGGIYLRSTERGGFDLISHCGVSDEFVSSTSHLESDSPQTALIEKGKSLFRPYTKIGLPLDSVRQQEGLHATAIIPMVHDNQTIGSMNLASRHYDEFPDSSRHAIETVAAMVGGAIIRIQAESAQRRSEMMFKTYVEKSPIGLFIVDETGRCVFTNDAGLRLIGYTESEFYQLRITDVINDIDKKRGITTFQSLVTCGEMTTELKIDHKDGSTISVIIQAVRIDEHSFLGFVTDITKIKEIEEQLRQSEKMQAIGQLAGGVAHDFNNQLAGILGYAELLNEEVTDNPDLSSYSRHIITAARRSADLTRQLLAFARKGKYLSVQCDLHQILQEAIDLLRRSIDKRITIDPHLNATCRYATGDPSQLQNALLNIGINARDAMPDGGTLSFHTEEIRLTPEKCDDSAFDILPGDFICISITDTGIGMSSEVQAHMFEPFFTTKEMGHGIGMGLAAVYGTIKNHRGLIEVESSPDIGTCFRIYLPLAAEAPEIKRHGKSHNATSTHLGSILIIDDEEVSLNITCSILERLGYTVITCIHSREAIQIYENQWRDISMVILDMVMPDMGGRETYFALKEINPDLIALVSSGFSLTDDARQILDAGNSRFLQKPFGISQLSKELEQLLTSQSDAT
jgi:PAS domain S-box-containing protein